MLNGHCRLRRQCRAYPLIVLVKLPGTRAQPLHDAKHLVVAAQHRNIQQGADLKPGHIVTGSAW